MRAVARQPTIVLAWMVISLGVVVAIAYWNDRRESAAARCPPSLPEKYRVSVARAAEVCKVKKVEVTTTWPPPLSSPEQIVHHSAGLGTGSAGNVGA